MNGKKYAENISQLALANVDFDMQNRHHISYNLMMIHANTCVGGRLQRQELDF